MRDNYYSRYVATVITVAFYIALFWLIAVALTGCATTKVRTEFVEVKVPVYVAPPEIEIPPEPEWETATVSEEDWLEYLRAMVRDLVRSWQYIEELRWTIEVQNEARRRIETE